MQQYTLTGSHRMHCPYDRRKIRGDRGDGLLGGIEPNPVGLDAEVGKDEI